MQAFPSSPLFFPPLDLGIRAEFRTFSVDEKGGGGGVNCSLWSMVSKCVSVFEVLAERFFLEVFVTKTTKVFEVKRKRKRDAIGYEKIKMIEIKFFL